MERKPAWRAAAEGISAERFGEELVLVHFDTGHYYSFNGTAADCWERLAFGATEAGLAAWLGSRYGIPPERVSPDVARFVGALREDGLVIPADPLPPGEPPPAPPAAPGAAYAPPAFEKFTDMEELLLLDPIHEVDASGWPRKPEDTPA